MYEAFLLIENSYVYSALFLRKTFLNKNTILMSNRKATYNNCPRHQKKNEIFVLGCLIYHRRREWYLYLQIALHSQSWLYIYKFNKMALKIYIVFFQDLSALLTFRAFPFCPRCHSHCIYVSIYIIYMFSSVFNMNSIHAHHTLTHRIMKFLNYL